MFKLPFLQSTKSDASTVTFQLSGLHCTSCSLNIDSALEDLPGVHDSSTSYAKSKTTIKYDPSAADLDQLKKTIESLGYQVL
jgi:copper chaperone CopZ